MFPLTPEKLVALAVAAFVLFVLWRAVGPRWDIRIDVDSERVSFVRGVALARQANLASFLRDDVRPAGRIVILARKDPTGRLHTRIKGNVDAGLQQRIRNFLIEML